MESTAAPSVVVRTGGPLSAIIHSKFLSVTDGWPEMVGEHLETEAAWSDILSDAATAGFALQLNNDDSCAIFTRDTQHGSAAILVEREWRDEFHLSAMGASRDAASTILKAFSAFMPPLPPSGDDTVPLTFWSFHPMAGGVRTTRRLPKLTWESVHRNYPTSIRDELTALSSATGPPAGGKLMTFYGPPGNGKSRLIQSLAASWSEWCRLDYIIDPDMMFHDSNYLNAVMLSEDYDDRWRLMVVEDGDEFLDVGAKSRVGYGVSRLLNLADGLVGQGLKLMVLITTNVNRVKFSKAMLRPGRCGAQIQFPPFTLDEAHEWCAANGIVDPTFDTSTKQTVSLAELYALKGATDAAL